jgi:hypothetical protein
MGGEEAQTQVNETFRHGHANSMLSNLMMELEDDDDDDDDDEEEQMLK